jgi:hypothetical protein
MAYTTIDDPGLYFNTKLYTGTGSSLANTGVGFQPDLVWIKGRSGATEHVLTDSVRGVTKELSSNDTGAEETVAQGLTAFGSDGFTVGTDGSYNTSSATYASWNFKAGGTASSNTDGSITSSVSANTTSGFSIVSYTGAGGASTVGHGLGVAPKMIIVKNRSSAQHWQVYHISTGNTKSSQLSGTGASDTASTYWNDTSPTSTVFSVGTGTPTNGSGNSIIAYCFAEKQGYSKFGSYTGNGNADGTFVYTGFKPAFIIVKSATEARNWRLWDNKRSTYNLTDKILYPDLSNAEATGDSEIDMLSNGFKLRKTSDNTSGETYIYMAFAENPFVTSTGVPATAR